MDWNLSSTNAYPSPDPTPTTNRFRDLQSTNLQHYPRELREFFPQRRPQRRYKKQLRDNLPAAINKPTIRRLARRGGVKRIEQEIYATAQMIVKERLKEILELAIAVCEHKKKKTLDTLDVVYALRVLGNPIYGFGSIVHGDEVQSRAEFMRKRRAGYAQNREAVQQQLAREARERDDRRIDEQVRRMGGLMGYR